MNFNANSCLSRDAREKNPHTVVQLGFMGTIACQSLLKTVISFCLSCKMWIRSIAPELGLSMAKFIQTLHNCKIRKDQIMSLSSEIAWLKRRLGVMPELGF